VKNHKEMYGNGMSMLLKKLYKMGVKDVSKEKHGSMGEGCDEEEMVDDSDEVGSFPAAIAKLSEKNVKEEYPQFDESDKDEPKKKKAVKGMAVVGFQSKKMRKMKA